METISKAKIHAMPPLREEVEATNVSRKANSMSNEAETDRQNEEDFVSGKVDFWDKAYFYPVPCPLCGVETRRMVNVPTGRADILAAMTAAHLRRMSKAAEAYLSLHISPPALRTRKRVSHADAATDTIIPTTLCWLAAERGVWRR